MAGCLPRTSFREQVAAAAKAGFAAMSIWPNIWRHAQAKDGLSLADMRMMLDDNGLALTDVDGCRDWTPPPRIEPDRLGPIRHGPSRQECFDVCAALGGATIAVAHFSDPPIEFDRDAAAFARLCDDAAAYGLRVGLEFVAFSDVSDAGAAWWIVEAAGRANGGLVIDLWHHAHGAGHGDDALLRQIPPERIFTVQYADGLLQPAHSLIEETMFHRAMPGEGELDVLGFLRTLRAMGVRAPWGPELYRRSFEPCPPIEVARQLADSARRLAAALALDA